MKSLFIYAFCSIIMGGGCLVLLWVTPFLILLFCMPLFLISTALGISHFISRFRSKSSSSFFSLLLGMAWLLLSLLFLLIVASWIGYLLSVPEDMLLLIPPRFLLYYHVPFFLIWLLLSILISASLIAKKPFWLVERKAKYIQILGILLCLYMIVGVRYYWVSISTGIADAREYWSVGSQNEPAEKLRGHHT